MIGKWNDEKHTHFWESLGNSNVNWVDFHTIIIDNSKPVNHNNDRLELFTSIKESKLKKIYIANSYMHRAKQIFNIDSHIKIDSSNWFETEYDSVFNSIKESIEDNKNTLVLISAGMGSKFLISELHKLYPKVLYIDIGSAFDKLLRGQHTRSNAASIRDLELYLKSLL
jgi:deoxyxylulose-5-phosphate synthase